MRFTIDTEIVTSKGLTLQEFSIVLYYLWGGEDIINEHICNDLWNKDYLIKTLGGYKINNNKFSEIENIAQESSSKTTKGDRFYNLADKMRELFPEGKKQGTNFYWRDSTSVIAQRLNIFFKKYGNKYSDKEIIDATERYVKSFNGNFQYMQLLKYFINKLNRTTGEINSELASYLANPGETCNTDWEVTLK